MSTNRAQQPRTSGDLDVTRLLSGESGLVVGRRQKLQARLEDLLCDMALWSRLVPIRLRRAASVPAQRAHNSEEVADEKTRTAGSNVLVLGIYGQDGAATMMRAVNELSRSQRRIDFALGALDEAEPELAQYTVHDRLRGSGKFENLNSLLAQRSADNADWTVVIDDDVELPRNFLDNFLFLAECFRLQLVQPALRRTSHAAWAVLRRERNCIARLTNLVEIGPLTAFHRSVAGELVPFPPLRMGWGLDLHWGALAKQHSWRLGVIDAVPVRHELRQTASGYSRDQAIAEMREFLAQSAHIDRELALLVAQYYRNWRYR